MRHRLVDALGRPGCQLRSIRSQDGPEAGLVTVSALLTAEGEGGRMLEEAVSNLSLDPPPASGRGTPGLGGQLVGRTRPFRRRYLSVAEVSPAWICRWKDR
ncbi:hypothetical protein [Streptomyces sp. H34-S4]|uniref:hypothetical protein n=1 Tax=Streptomyces sp. H34-S4 TaxID=2996463 RepID=UPI003B6369B8